MKRDNFAIVTSTSINPTFSSGKVDTGQMLYISAQVITAGGTSPSYAVKMQGSNDPCPYGNVPDNFTPTNWTDITGATVTVIANGAMLIPKTDVCYRWIRFVSTYTSGTGNVTINVFGIGA